MEISTISLEEIEVAANLWEATGLTRPWNDPATDIQCALKTASSTVLAGRIDNTLIATVMVGYDGHRGWVYYLAVDPNHQGKGLGRSMIEAAEKWLGAKGVPKVLLLVRRENAKVLGFYETLGYSLNDVTVMQKTLTKHTQ